MWEWLRQGGTDEDGTYDWTISDILEGRYVRHFHDPLKPWDQAGLTLTAPDSASNLVWAQDPGQEYSWPSARNLFYQALTTGEEQAYAATFTILGHLMHLVADMAVPAHVRNDAHPISFIPGGFVPRTWLGDFYEQWAKKNEENPSSTLNYTALQVGQSIFTRANPESPAEQGFAPLPISALWDQNIYDGSNPEATRVADPALVGLAEFTNANFLSQDTMFVDYPYPTGGDSWLATVDWLNPVLVVAEDGVEDFRHYYLGDVTINPGGAGERPIRFAGTSFITRETWLYGNVTEQIFQLDDIVFADYAEALLPRAVGYSTALLDYFFRGKLEIQKGTAHLGPGMAITGFDFEVKNVSLLDSAPELFGPDPDFGENSTIDLVYGYVPPGEIEKVYFLEQGIYTVNDVSDPINSDFVPLTVSLSQNIPLGASEIAFTLVYKGALGNENGGVAVGRYDFTGTSRIAYVYQQDGYYVYPSNIYSVLPDGSTEIVYTASSVGGDTETWFYGPDWSRDGTMMALDRETYTNSTGAYSYAPDIISLDSSQNPGSLITSLSFTAPDPWATDYYILRPSFSPDGTELVAIVSDFLGGYALVRFDIATGNGTYVVDNYRNFWIHKDLAGIAPAWSPQGDKIAYYIDSTDDSYPAPPTSVTDIYMIDLTDDSDHNLTDDGFSLNVDPSWSPDGEWFAFVSDRDGGGILDIWVMDKDGNNKQKLRDCASSCREPSFSPDGLQLSYYEGVDLYRMNLDGSNISQVTTGGVLTYMSTWSPFFDEP